MLLAANPRFGEELRGTREYVAGMTALGQRVKLAAIAASPHDTGHYAESFAVVVIDGEVYVTNWDIAAHLIEWGSINTPAYAPLRRGVRGAGLALVEADR